MPEFFQFGIGENGLRQLNQGAAFRHWIQKAAARADHGLSRGNDLFADGVNGRVGDLGEELFEIVVKQLRLLRENGQRRVRAHGAQRLDAVVGHRTHDETQILEGVAEGLLFLKDFAVGQFRRQHRFGQVFQQDVVFVQPLAIWFGAGIFPLELLIGDDPTLLGVDQKHASRLQTPLDGHPIRGDGQHARLRGHDDHVVLGDVIAGRAQAIAIEARPDEFAIREGHRCRAVPRLGQAGVVFVKGAPLRVHALMVLPGLRDHHHHRVRQLAPGQREQLDHVVELRRVAVVGVDDGNDLPDVLAEQFGDEVGLSRLHPVDVPAQGIDFAVVRDVTVGMRAVPAGKGVSAEPRMHQRQGRGERRVAQVGIIPRHLLRHQHALIGDGPRRQAGNIKPFAAGNPVAVADGLLRDLADDIQLALKSGLVFEGRAAGDEHLRHERLRSHGRFAQGGIVHWHRAPAQQGLTFGGDDGGDGGLDGFALAGIFGQEHHADAVMAGHGQAEPEGDRLRRQKIVGDLKEDARAVAGVRLAAHGTAVVEVDQNLQGVTHRLVGFFALDVDNKAQTAGVVFKLRVVKTLFQGCARGPLVDFVDGLHCFFVAGTADKPTATYFLLNFDLCAIIVFKKLVSAGFNGRGAREFL